MTQQNPGFRTVMRGYEPSEVDRAVAELQARRAGAQPIRRQLGGRDQAAFPGGAAGGAGEQHRTRIAALEQEQREVVAPSYADLGLGSARC